jgi:hypothetical protein
MYLLCSTILEMIDSASYFGDGCIQLGWSYAASWSALLHSLAIALNL